MKKIISISINDNFIQTFTDQVLYKKGKKDYSKICIIFPGKRPFLYLREHLTKKIKHSYFPPEMITINEFINQIFKRTYPNFQMINEIDGIYQLYQIMEKNDPTSKSFFDAFPWIKKIYSFINQLDIENIDDDILRNIQDNAEIGYNVPKQINELFQNIIKIRNKFHDWLEKNKLFTRGYSYLKTVQLIDTFHTDQYDHIYFAGLFGLTKTEKKVIKHLLNDDQVDLIWHGHPDNWNILKSLQQYFEMEIEFLEYSPAKENNISLYSSFDYHSEAVQIFQSLNKVNSIENSVIVTPRNETLFPLLSLCIDPLKSLNKIDKFNISLDYSIGKTALYTLIRQLIECQLNCKQKKARSQYFIDTYLKFLNNPFIKNMKIDNIPIRDILKNIKKKLTDPSSTIYNKTYTELKDISTNLKKEHSSILNKVHKVFFDDLEHANSLGYICSRFESILEFIIKNSDLRSYILSGEIFNLLFEKLSELKKTMFSDNHFPKINETIQLWPFFMNLMGNLTINFHTIPLQKLEIIGMLETRVLNFKDVYILDVQEGIIPSEKHIDPLIPIGVLEQIDLPDHRFQVEMQEYYFYRLIRNAENVHIYYINNPEMDRSRLIERIIWEKEKKLKKLNSHIIHDIHFPVNFMNKNSKKYIEKNDIIQDKIQNLVFSPSSIDNYIFCQIRFYYEDILKINIPEDLNMEIDALKRGTIIHNILNETFKAFQGEMIDHSFYSKIKSKLQDIIDQYFHDKINSGEYYLFQKIIKIKLEQFLLKYIKNCTHKFKILSTETELTGIYTLNKIKVPFKGRIDRIDEIRKDDQSTRMIIDYKTGNSIQKFKYNDNIDQESNIDSIRKHIQSLQLPVYIFLYKENNPEFKIEDIEAQLMFLGDLKTKELLYHKKIDKNAIYEYYINILNVVLKDIFNGDKSLEKYTNTKCEFCNLQRLCKYR